MSKLDQVFEGLRYQVLNKRVEQDKWQSQVWFEVTEPTKQAIKELFIGLMDANRYADHTAKNEDDEFVISYDALRRKVDQL